MTNTTRPVWYKALDPDELPEGRVQSKTLGVHTVCMTHFEGQYAALLNKCPHQGGPLAEGSIENGMLRCPWHGWDYHPTTGSPPEGYGDCVHIFRWRSCIEPRRRAPERGYRIGLEIHGL